MQKNVLTNLAFHVEAEDLIRRLRLEDEAVEEFIPVFNRCVQIANPKMIYGVTDVHLEGERGVKMGDVMFESRILNVNMQSVKAAYPYVCTSGREAYEYALSLSDEPLMRYWADATAEAILAKAMSSATETIRQRHGTGKLYVMSPGSLPDWPTTEQRPLFKLLGGVTGDIGVELTESCLMLPVKSISGILFESEQHYTNCSMCPREGCEGRRAPYDPNLSADRYGI